MALQIKKELTSRGGLKIPTNSLILFETIFPQTGEEMHCNLHVYKDLNEFKTGNEIYPLELTGFFGIVKKLNSSDYESLTPRLVHQWIKQILEEIPSIGSGNVVII